MTSLFQTRTLQKIAASLLLVVFCTGLFTATHIQPVYAQDGTEDDSEGSYYDGPSFDELFEKYSKQCAEAALIQFVINAVLGFALTQVPVTDWASAVKDMIEDCLVSATKNALLELVTGQTVGWSQKGYGGNPSFVQNVTQYLTGIADQAAGTYIQNIGGGFLCSPFRSQIQLALTQYYQGQSGRGGFGGYGGGGGITSCTLSQMAGVDVDAFLGGDFYAGGWEAWIEMSANPYNTPYGAYLQTVEELNRVVAEKANEATWKLDFGNGFLSKEVQNCYTENWVEEDGTVHKDYYSYCDPPQVITPGDTIKTSLEKTFGIKLDAIVAADEINEIISLVAVYLLSDILTKDEGLASYNYSAGFDEPLVVIDGGVWGDDGSGGGGGGSGQCTPMSITAGTPGTLGVIPNTADFIASDANPKKEFTATDIPGRNYSRVRAEFDLTVGSYDGRAGADQYNVFWLHRGPGLGSFIWGANDVAEVVHAKQRDGGYNIRLATSVNQCLQHDQGFRSPLQEGGRYHVVVDYNPGANTMSVTFSGDGNGGTSQSTTVTVLQSHDQQGRGGFFFVVGSEYNFEGREGMTGDGWKWENIEVEFFPGPATGGQ